MSGQSSKFSLEQQQLSDFLEPFLTPERQERFRQVLSWRTAHLQVVLADLRLGQNAGAVVRTCDAIGIQHVHVVETCQQFKIDPNVAMGSQKWLTLHQHRGEEALERCYTKIRKRGMMIAAATMSEQSQPILEVPLEQPVALVFGNELVGLSQQALDLADCHFHVPMFGFVESYNVSVAAALSLQILKDRLHQSDFDWHLSSEEMARLYLLWMQRTIKRVDALERLFKRGEKASTSHVINDSNETSES